MNHQAEVKSLGGDSARWSPIARAASGVEAYQVVLIFTGALILIAYGGALGYEFVYDDRPQILTNTFVHSWRFAPRYFTEQVWESITPGVVGNYYRPMFLLWLRLNHMLFGLAPWGWHLASILAHLGVTLSVYSLALRLTRDRLTAAFAAMIFGVHPVHVEGVVWVSGVTEPMLALFFIPSFLAYLRAREGGERARWWHAWSAFLFLLALFSKETAVILPAFILIYEGLWGADSGDRSFAAGPWGTRVRNALKGLMPYVAVTPVYLVLRVIALKGLSHVLTSMPLATVIFTAPSLVWFYLKRLVWPVRMAFVYNMLYVRSPRWVDFGFPLAATSVVILLLWAWGRRTGRGASAPGASSRVIAFASVWIFLPLLPPLNITALPIHDFVHDRYTYLPSVGFAILLAMALRSIDIGRCQLGALPGIQGALAAALAVAGVGGSLAEGIAWSNNLLLYHRGFSIAPCEKTEADLANALVEGGHRVEGIALYKDLLAHFPSLWEGNYNIGLAYYQLGRLEEAERYLRRAVEADSTKAGGYFYLGLTELKLGRADAAAEYIHQAVRISPNVCGVHFARGIVLKLQGDFPGASEEFKKELALNPDQALARDQIAEIERRKDKQTQQLAY